MSGDRFILRVSTSEASGPSGAGDRAGTDRNPRRDSGIQLSAPGRRQSGSDAFARMLAKAQADAIREWVAEWPTTPGDGTFLADVAADGLARADRIAGGAA